MEPFIGVEAENFDRGAADGRDADDQDALPLEMVGPVMTARVEEFG